jgi:deoxyribonuclease V
MVTWPATAEELAAEQERVAARVVEPWTAPDRALRLGACAVVFGTRRHAEVGWAAAVVEEAGEVLATATRIARIEAPFKPGQLALREGPILERVVTELACRPDVLLVAAAGRDHPRRAGLALHLGAVIDLPTAGVTDQPLLAVGEEPAATWGSQAPLRLGGEVVGYRVRTRGGTRPVVAHAGWRTSAAVAAEVVLTSCAVARWPEPLRLARRLARELRAVAGDDDPADHGRTPR